MFRDQIDHLYFLKDLSGNLINSIDCSYVSSPVLEHFPYYLIHPSCIDSPSPISRINRVLASSGLDHIGLQPFVITNHISNEFSGYLGFKYNNRFLPFKVFNSSLFLYDIFDHAFSLLARLFP